MKEQLIGILLSVMAGCIIMILHELPKSLVYYAMNRKNGNQHVSQFMKLHKYIDPVGLLFCAAAYAGFSKPYMYRIKEKKVNLILGITGFVSLICIFGVSLGVLNIGFGGRAGEILTAKYQSEREMMNAALPVLFWLNMSMISLGTVFVNLFPVSTFDLGLIVAGRSPARYLSIIKNDYFIKLILILALAVGIISSICGQILNYLIL